MGALDFSHELGKVGVRSLSLDFTTEEEMGRLSLLSYRDKGVFFPFFNLKSFFGTGQHVQTASIKSWQFIISVTKQKEQCSPPSP